MNIDSTYIPESLTSRDQWVVWRSEQRGGKPTKVPYNARTGQLAESDNVATWTPYAIALAAAERFDGIGYVFSPDDPYSGVDLDDCIIEEKIAPWAEAQLLTLNSYSEVSPSGTGIKVWVEGKLPGSAKPRKEKIPANIIPPDVPGSIEMYSERRFFTVTGWHVEGTPRDIQYANGALTDLYEQLKPTPIVLPTYTTRTAGRKYLERWAQHKIDYAVDRVAHAVDGQRHNERYAMSRLLGGLVPHGLATADQIARALFDANQPKTAAQRSEYKTILDGIEDGARTPLALPEEPPQPTFDDTGHACCPVHTRVLSEAKSGNGWVCHARDSSTESGWCRFWWDGDGYIVPQDVDPVTGEILHTDANDFLLNAHRSDTGNAECLAHVSGDDLRFCHTRDKWLIWQGSRWIVDEDGAAQRSMIAVVRARYRACEAIPDPDQRKKAVVWAIGCENNGKIEAGMNVAGSLTAFSTTIDQYDHNPMIAACIGATIDLQACVHRAVRRNDFITMQFGATYNPEATCERWIQFLGEVFDGNDEVIGYIQRAVGYSLTGDTREQKMFLLHGGGANGKSVFLDVLTTLLGDYAGNASFETFDANKRSESTNDLAALRGKRLVTVIETEDGKRLAEARVKSVTGQDPITCRFLYGEYFTYRPTYKIWLAMNHLPSIRGTDKGIWRRIQLIPFTQDFSGREDKTLSTTLHGEIDGILQWALEGLRQWWQRGLDTPEIVTSATAKYRSESDQTGRWITDVMVQMSNVSVTVAQAYQSYKAWCESNGETAMSQSKLSRVLLEKGIDQAHPRNQRTWIGLGLRVDEAE
jgi:putative DNA primase/helicase